MCLDSFCNTDLTGESGKLHVTNSQGKVKIGESECLEGEMTKETRQKLDNCSGKKTVVMEEATKNTSDAICVSRTNQGTMNAVCIDECADNKKCVQLCMNHGEALNADTRISPSEVNLEVEIFPGTLFVNDSLNKHMHGGENVILYPDWRCQDAVEIQENGSLRLVDNYDIMDGRQVLKWVVGTLT